MKARDNPFRVARVLTSIRYEIPAASLLPRLEALGYRAAIVGPHGSGKTTLLEDLEDVLASRGFRISHVRLDTEGPRLPREWRSIVRKFDATDIVCLDGAEQLGVFAWRRFRWSARRAGGLIITTHEPGRLTTLIECTTSVGLLERIMQRLAPGDASANSLSTAPRAEELFARHHGNIRDALRELYDVYAAANR